MTDGNQCGVYLVLHNESLVMDRLAQRTSRNPRSAKQRLARKKRIRGSDQGGRAHRKDTWGIGSMRRRGVPTNPHFMSLSMGHENLLAIVSVTLCNTIVHPGRNRAVGSDFAGFEWGKPRNRPSGRPSAGRTADFEASPIRIRPKCGPAARFSARKHYCLT